MSPRIRTYVVVSAEGEVLGVKLNRVSAEALGSLNKGSSIEVRMADKALPKTTKKTETT